MHVWKRNLKGITETIHLCPFSFWVFALKWSLVCSANTSEPWNVTLRLWLSVDWRLCTTSRSGRDSPNCFWLYEKHSLLTTFKAQGFNVIRKSSEHSGPFSSQTHERWTEELWVYLSSPTQPDLSSQIISPSTTVLILLSLLTLLIVSLYLSSPLCIPRTWSICLSRRPFLCCISVSIHLSKSLSVSLSLSLPGTCAQSNRSHHPMRVPLQHRDLCLAPSLYTSGCTDNTIHQSSSFSLTHINTDLCFDIQRCPTLQLSTCLLYLSFGSLTFPLPFPLICPSHLSLHPTHHPAIFHSVQ